MNATEIGCTALHSKAEYTYGPIKSSQESFQILIPKPLAHCIHNQNKKRLGLKMASCISAFTLTLKPFKLIFIIDCCEFFTSILAMAMSRDFLISIKE